MHYHQPQATTEPNQHRCHHPHTKNCRPPYLPPTCHTALKLTLPRARTPLLVCEANHSMHRPNIGTAHRNLLPSSGSTTRGHIRPTNASITGATTPLPKIAAQHICLLYARLHSTCLYLVLLEHSCVCDSEYSMQYPKLELVLQTCSTAPNALPPTSGDH